MGQSITFRYFDVRSRSATKSPERARKGGIMPYWSSSKVGAVPQGQPSKPKKRNERTSARKKGITMEDLKKQTAIRLAKEQQGRSATAPQDFSPSVERTRGVVPNKHRSNKNFGTPEPARSRPYHQVPVATPQRDRFQNSSSAGSVHSHPGVVPPSYHGVYDRPHTHNGGGSLSSADDQSRTPTRHSSASQIVYHAEHSRSAPRPTKSAPCDSTGKPKLPHGLTVHELKEMTKARLQAEASDQIEGDPVSLFAPVPSVVRASPDYRDPHVRASPTDASPTPFFVGRGARSPYPDSTGHFDSRSVDSRNDGWESGSVNTQTSDYFGSENAFGMSSFTDQPEGFNRPRALSGNNVGFVSTREMTPSREDLLQNRSFYSDVSPGFTPNRRRAATLSPRAGLSHLHEDRPVFGGQDIPGLPSFQHHTPGSSRIPPRSLGAFGTPEPALMEEQNRSRTYSAASLPAISHTAEEFALGENPSFAHLGNAFPGGGSNGSSVTGLSDVFRESPGKNGGMTFVGGPELSVPVVSSVGLGSIDSYEPRGRASTWGETTATPASDLFGPGLIQGRDRLSDDLASILQLSVTDENHQDSLSGLM